MRSARRLASPQGLATEGSNPASRCERRSCWIDPSQAQDDMDPVTLDLAGSI